MIKLPRPLENDPQRPAVEAALARDARPLWERGTIAVAHVPFTPQLARALSIAQGARQLERGLEHIEKLLANEEHGLAALREREGTEPSGRASRLLIIADEGTERFYRSCEAVLRRHADRVLGLRVSVSIAEFSSALYGDEQLVKAVLVSGRDLVAKTLLALCP